MTLSELTVMGLRGIEHAELAIQPRLALGCAGHGSGILLHMRNSECRKHCGQDHLRVIARRWSLWASSARASSHPGGDIRADRYSETQPQPCGQHPVG